MPRCLFTDRHLSLVLSLPLEQKHVCSNLPLKFNMKINDVKINNYVACVEIRHFFPPSS